MRGLFDVVSRVAVRWYGGPLDGVARRVFRAVTRPSARPVWSAERAVCAAGCGRPLALGDPHFTVLRQVEARLASGDTQPFDADDLAYVHLGCWPGRDARCITAAPDEPESAVVRSAVTS